MTDAQVDFTTQFETVYDLLSEHDHDALRQVLRDQQLSVESVLRPEGSLWGERFVEEVGLEPGVKAHRSSFT